MLLEEYKQVARQISCQLRRDVPGDITTPDSVASKLRQAVMNYNVRPDFRFQIDFLEENYPQAEVKGAFDSGALSGISELKFVAGSYGNWSQPGLSKTVLKRFLYAAYELGMAYVCTGQLNKKLFCFTELGFSPVRWDLNMPAALEQHGTVQHVAQACVQQKAMPAPRDTSEDRMDDGYVYPIGLLDLRNDAQRSQVFANLGLGF